MEIGLNVVPRPYVAAGIQSGEETFRDALIRLRKERRLFVEDTSAVTFLTPNLFRATIKLPAEAPVGTYEVDVRLFADNTELARATSALEVVKVGIEQFVASARAEPRHSLRPVHDADGADDRLVRLDRVPAGLIRQAAHRVDRIEPRRAEHMRAEGQRAEHIHEGRGADIEPAGEGAEGRHHHALGRRRRSICG